MIAFVRIQPVEKSEKCFIKCFIKCYMIDSQRMLMKPYIA